MTKLLGSAALLAAIAFPAASFAATYAYVNTSGDVSSVEAVSANTALTTAPGISAHSGVILLGGTTSDTILDTSVSTAGTGMTTSAPASSGSMTSSNSSMTSSGSMMTSSSTSGSMMMTSSSSMNK